MSSLNFLGPPPRSPHFFVPAANACGHLLIHVVYPYFVYPQGETCQTTNLNIDPHFLEVPKTRFLRILSLRLKTDIDGIIMHAIQPALPVEEVED